MSFYCTRKQTDHRLNVLPSTPFQIRLFEELIDIERAGACLPLSWKLLLFIMKIRLFIAGRWALHFFAL